MSKKSYIILTTFCILIMLFGSTGSIVQAAPGSSPSPDLDRPGIVEENSYDPAAPLITVGTPGLSLRYTDSLGTLEHGYLADNTHLNYPWGIGANGANIWIAELFGRRAMKFTNQGTLLATINPNPGFEVVQNHELWEAADVATDASGNVWIVDSGAGYILKFDSNGQFVGQLGQAYINNADNQHFKIPGGIAFDSQGNIYVSDGSAYSNEFGNHRIQVFNSSGAYLRTIGEPGVFGSDNTHFKNPAHIFIDKTDRLFVADMMNNRVQIYDVSVPNTPTYLATLSGLSRPSGVAANATNIFVADRYNHRVQVFNSTSYALVGTIGTGVQGSSNAQFRFPSDVDLDDAGNLYVSDYANMRVQEFSATAPFAYIRTFGTTGAPYVTDNSHYFNPRGLATDLQGNLYLTESYGQRLVKLNASKQFVWALGQAGVIGTDTSHFNFPDDVAVDSTGRVFVADTWNHRIMVFGTDGALIQSIGGLLPGTENRKFNCPKGLAVGPNNYLYIADTCNQRIQILDSQLAFYKQLGVTAVDGSDNAHFKNPRDVTVDTSGNIYVADTDNQRIQVFDKNLVYLRTIGVTGKAGADFDHFNGPDLITLDRQEHLFISDSWNNRVQVFTKTGAYLTTIGGAFGNLSGEMRGAYGVAFDSTNNMFVADTGNHRIQKFTFGVPNWQQMNVNAFGDFPNNAVSALESFGGKLYAGTQNAYGAQIWRMTDPGVWSRIVVGGFGDANTNSINDFIAFNSKLYIGVTNKVTGGKVYRSNTGDTWAPMTLPGLDLNNGAITRFIEYNHAIFAATSYFTYTHGAEIWTSSTGDSGDWMKVYDDSFGTPYNRVIESFASFNNYLYFGTYNRQAGGGAEVWRSANGAEGTWSKVNTGGFGDPGNFEVSALAPFKGYLYASTSHMPGAGIELWRCQVCSGSDWKQVTLSDLNVQSTGPSNLMVDGNELILAIGNPVAGFGVRRSTDGVTWTLLGSGGLGNANNKSLYYSGTMPVINNPTYVRNFSMTLHNNELYLGTMNAASGGEVWLYGTTSPIPSGHKVYLPLTPKS